MVQNIVRVNPTHESSWAVDLDSILPMTDKDHAGRRIITMGEGIQQCLS